MKRFSVIGPYNQDGIETNSIEEAVEAAAWMRNASIYDNEKEGRALNDEEIADLLFPSI